MSEENTLPLVIEPHEVSEAALRGIIENFIERDGTDYGAVEMTAEKKFENLKKQVIRGEVLIVFDPETESVTLLTKQNYTLLSRPKKA